MKTAAYTKCSYADRYQAKRKPTCGCTVCNVKWEAAEKWRNSRNKIK